jgi:hypothetical protein
MREMASYADRAYAATEGVVRRVIRLRNLAMSQNATFEASHRWTRGELPISLPWRSTLWRYIVPVLWVTGWMFWIWMVSIETPRQSAIFYALLFVGVPLILAVTAGWWVIQLVHRRVSATLLINDDYLEWQFDMGSDVDLLADCSRFEFAGKRDYDARIEWDMATPGAESADGWPQWTKRWRLLDSIKSDRTLYGRDVGLDRDDLDSLCKLLNQLREEAMAQR